jgi:hypothetical protein
MVKCFRSLIVACGLVLAAVPAVAQDLTPDRPYRGLFRAGIADATQVLSVSGQAGVGYDTAAFLAQRETGFVGTPVPTDLRGHPYSMLTGGLSYSASGKRLSTGASLSSMMRRYQDFSSVTSYSASAGASFKLTKSTTVSANEVAAYQPWGILFRFPELTQAPIGQSSAPSADLAAGKGTYYTYLTSASLMQQLSRRTSLAVGYNYQRSDYTTISRFRTQGAFLRLSRGFTRNFGLHVGGGYSNTIYVTGPLRGQARSTNDDAQYRAYTLDTGLDYNRRLGLTRRTSLTFSTGGAAIKQESGSTRYDAIGSASVAREIGRTWTAAFLATHDISFLESVRAPYFYNGINASLGGLISRRTSFRSSAGATFGQIGFVREPARSNRLNSGNARVGVGIAISRHLSVDVDYMYYAYSLAAAFVPQDLFGPSFPARMNHHSIAVSLSAWAPILERGRRSNAAR